MPHSTRKNYNIQAFLKKIKQKFAGVVTAKIHPLPDGLPIARGIWKREIP
jgi:hypothetical protein